MTVRYDHSQPGGAILGGLGFGAFICFMVGTVALTSGREGERAAVAALVGAVLCVLVGCGVVFRRLRVVVTDGDVTASFGSGWPRRRIALADVRGARAVRNAWLYGWGIKLVPGGWMFNVSGLDAVEIDLDRGRKFRIGTDDPQGLLAAVESARARVRG